MTLADCSVVTAGAVEIENSLPLTVIAGPCVSKAARMHRSDGPNMIALRDLEGLLRDLIALDRVVKGSRLV
jgi:3-deoxy-D-manno-octulosonic acid (KDO) 8-phosphate synthase